MGNKVKFNLKNVHAAKLTEKEEGGSTKFEYGVPKAIPGAVSICLGKKIFWIGTCGSKSRIH